jgi:hypothetical protein
MLLTPKDVELFFKLHRALMVPEGTRLFFVNLPVFAGQVGPALHMTTGRPDLQVYPLTLAPELFVPDKPLLIVQEDDHTLLVMTMAPGWFAGDFGEQVQLGWFGSSRAELHQGPFSPQAAAGPLPFRVRVVEASAQGITRLRFTFDVALDDPRYRFFVSSSQHAAAALSIRGVAGPFDQGAARIVYAGSALPAVASEFAFASRARSPSYERLQWRQRVFDRIIRALAKCP